MRSLVFLLVGCAPVEGRYRLENVQYVLEPRPAVRNENAIDGSLQTVTVQSGDLYAYADHPELSLTGSYERFAAGFDGAVDVLDEEIVFTFGGASFAGEREGDGFVVTYRDAGEVEEVLISVDDYWYALLGRYEEVHLLTLTFDAHRLHAEGTQTVAETNGWRESDEWSAFWPGQVLSGVYDDAGAPIENEPGRDDCSGDYCEISTTDYSETYRVSFDGVRVGG